MHRRSFLRAGVVGGVASLALPRQLRAEPVAADARVSVADSPLDELTIADLRTKMESGEMTARSIAEGYLARISAIDKTGPAINALMETNPDALAIADALDAERKAGKVRGPLHGIPILLKDNIDTADKMLTTAGSLALVGAPTPRDATIVARLRDAGAVILGKTNLSEWANFRSTRSTSGWSGRGGQTRNPYVLDRNPCGSSSGSGAAIAANLCAIAIGTETDGSVTCPASINGLVGIKPTVGLVSRAGIIPIAHSQDTAGPMTRTVTDAAVLLDAIAAADSRDLMTGASRGHIAPDYTVGLRADALRGVRIGVAREWFGFNDDVDALMKESLDAMTRAGATLVDVKFATRGKFDASELDVLLYEFKTDLAKYLVDRGATQKSLADLIEFNTAHAGDEMPWFGQELFTQANEKGSLASAKYRRALANNHRLTREQGIDAVLKEHRVRAVVAPTAGPAWTTDLLNGDHTVGGFTSYAAVAGYPHVTVPAGVVHELPIGLSFVGTAWTEAALLGYAFAFEQATKARRAPRFIPSLSTASK